MPQATAWPFALGLGLTLLAAGVATSLAFTVIGALIFVVSLGGWIGQLLPGKGHVHEPLVEPEQRPRPVTPTVGVVELLRPGTPGYRFQLPLEFHPLSSGLKGGLIGGLVMPLPALLYGFVSGHGPWFPVNLLAGMVIPGLGEASLADLEQFNPTALVLGLAIHATFSAVFGLMLGVLLPTLPALPGGNLVWAGLLPPLAWSAASYGVMGIVNPLMERYVDWPWFIASQFVFGLTCAIVVINSQTVAVPPAGRGPDAPTEPPAQPEGEAREHA
jgi:hypothetical protein